MVGSKVAPCPGMSRMIKDVILRDMQAEADGVRSKWPMVSTADIFDGISDGIRESGPGN